MRDEKRYRKQSGIITAAINVVVFIIIYFAIAWREPNPPIPEYGIELSFGLVEAGANPDVPVDQPDEITESEPEEQTLEEITEEPVEETAEEPTEEVTDPVDQPVEEVQEIESPDIVRETVKEIPEPVKEVKEEVVEQPKPKEAEPVKKEEPKESKQTDNNTTNKETEKGNTETSGDQGDPESKIDERALYGKKGSGDLDGASLQMTGWSWDSKPNPQDNSEDTGTIVFQIKIDQDGYIVEIKTITSNVTPKVEQVYRRSIEQLTFSQTSQYQPAPYSTGTITFILKRK